MKFTKIVAFAVIFVSTVHGISWLKLKTFPRLFTASSRSPVSSSSTDSDSSSILDLIGENDQENYADADAELFKQTEYVRHGNALIKAVLYENLKEIKYFVENTSDDFKLKALKQAASKGYLDAVECLFKKVTKHKEEALIAASKIGAIKVVRYLIKQGCKDTRDGTALTSAALNGHLDVVKFLIKKANVEAAIGNGQALINAATNGHILVVRYLIGPKSSLKFDRSQCNKAFKKTKSKDIKVMIATYLNIKNIENIEDIEEIDNIEDIEEIEDIED